MNLKKAFASIIAAAVMVTSIPVTGTNAEASELSWNIISSKEGVADEFYKAFDDVVIGRLGGKLVLIDKQIEVIRKTDFTQFETYGDNILVSKPASSSKRDYAIISKYGSTVNDFGEHSKLECLINSDLYIANDGDKISFYNASGKLNIPQDTIKYDYIGHYAEGYLFVLTNAQGKCALYRYDKKFENITSYDYTSIENTVAYDTSTGDLILKAKKLNGESGFLVNGQEMCFDNAIQDNTGSEYLDYRRINLNGAIYYVKIKYASQDAYMSAMTKFIKHDYTLIELSNMMDNWPAGVDYAFYSVAGKRVDTDYVLRRAFKKGHTEKNIENKVSEIKQFGEIDEKLIDEILYDDVLYQKYELTEKGNIRYLEKAFNVDGYELVKKYSDTGDRLQFVRGVEIKNLLVCNWNGKDNGYSGSASGEGNKNVTVSVGKTSVKSAKNVKGKKAQITLKSVNGASGYQVAYSTNKKFKSKKTVNTHANVTTVKGLKKKTYYFKARAYKTVDGKKYYGSWSSSKKLKISK